MGAGASTKYKEENDKLKNELETYKLHAKNADANALKVEPPNSAKGQVAVGATAIAATVGSKEPTVVRNDPDAIKAPQHPTLVDNTLLFMPKTAVAELYLEPNMDDKGHSKDLWYGRVWELRELLALQYRMKQNKIKDGQQKLSEDRVKELNRLMEEPEEKKRLSRLAARWRGAAYRKHCNLSVLDGLRFANLRGVLVYCHGSGGCSWDNFRICRMIAGMGVLVIAPDGFAYPPETAMGQMRHKALLPLKRASDDTDYWKGDLMYDSGSKGQLTYSTEADKVLEEPGAYRELYEKCYQLRRSELHFIMGHLPQWIQLKGFYIGGTSEGAMTVARFDDHRYGEMVCGRFINSFSVEYCYFTPEEEDGQIGGQLDVPTLNIIGTKDQYFGPEDSVAKIVAEDDDSGYGDKNLTGNGFNTFVKQGVQCGLVCVLEAGVHSPCTTHDNFLRSLFDAFFTRPGSIWELDAQWAVDPTMAELIRVTETAPPGNPTGANVTQLFVPRMTFPQKMSLREVETARKMSRHFKAQIAEQLAKEEEAIEGEQAENKKMLDSLRAQTHKAGGNGFSTEKPKANYYGHDKQTNVLHKKEKNVKAPDATPDPV